MPTIISDFFANHPLVRRPRVFTARKHPPPPGRPPLSRHPSPMARHPFPLDRQPTGQIPPSRHPTPRADTPWQTVNRRAVRTPLECILVYIIFKCTQLTTKLNAGRLKENPVLSVRHLVSIIGMIVHKHASKDSLRGYKLLHCSEKIGRSPY